MKQGKVWGTTELLLKTPFIEVHKLAILPFMCCSLHQHKFKHNAFYVSTGLLLVEVHKFDYDLIDKTSLRSGEFTTVKPGEFHRFATTEEGMTGIEIYYPEGLSEDIIRRGVGGKNEPNANWNNIIGVDTANDLEAARDIIGKHHG